MLKLDLGKALVKVLRKEANSTKVKVNFRYADSVLVEFKTSKKGVYASFKRGVTQDNQKIYKRIASYQLYSLKNGKYTPLDFSKEYNGVKTNALDYVLTKIGIPHACGGILSFDQLQRLKLGVLKLATRVCLNGCF